MCDTKIIYIKLLIIIASLLCGQATTAQLLVWPGDTNNSGQVTNLDVLYLGVAFGTTGPARDSITSDWGPQTGSLIWNQNFPITPFINTPVNYAHADCNGDGFIDQDDLDVINQNYGLQNIIAVSDTSFQAGMNDPLLTFSSPDTISIGSNTILNIGVELLDNIPIDFYGIAFSIEYDTTFVVEDSTSFTTNPIWINPGQEQLLELGQDNGAGRFDVAISRTNQSVATGMGNIGVFSLIIEDNVFDIVAPDTDFDIEIKDIRFIDEAFNIIPVQESAVIINLIAANENIIKDHDLKVFPNPATNYLNIQSDKLQIQKIECYNSLGQVLFSHKAIYNYSTRIPLDSDLTHGIYFLKIYTDEGVVIRQFYYRK